MNFPSLPTDSLAKFQAVGGLALFASLLVFLFLEVRSIEDALPQMMADSDAISLEREILKYRRTDLNEERQIVLDRLKQIDSDILKIKCPSAKCQSLKSERSNIEAKGKKMVLEGHTLEEKELALEFKALQVRPKVDWVRSRIQTYKELRWIYWLLLGLGACVMLNGFYKWGAKEALEQATRKISKNTK